MIIGKTENIWDHATHTNPCVVKDCSNGDIADDSYHQYKRDVEMMRELGLDFYRFSLSWTRILPTSFPDKINEAGVQYYNNLIDEMLKYNIKPMITLYHWDLPQKLQDMGGWTNPEIVNWFADYARIAFELFGDRVTDWITINEPHQVCYHGYGDDTLAPLLNIKGVADYLCAKNLLLAHAKAYHIYDKEFRPSHGGKIFIALSAQWYDTEYEEFVDAAKEANDFTWAIYSHPIFSETGDFPPVVKKYVAQRSAEQGFYRSRLPEFTEEEIDYVRGTSDYFGLNHYLTYYVYRNQSLINYYESPSFEEDMGVITYIYDEWQIGESKYTKFVPWGFYKLLTRIREDYGNPPVIITENGFATKGGLNDEDRVTYYRHYISAMLDAMEEGSDVRAYTAWSLMDNFEWLAGYTERFGLYEVDYESPERTRTPRKSAFVYKQIVRTRELDMHYEPDTDFVPWGFYKLLTRIREDYGNPPVIITENGFATKGGLNDEDRVTYYRHYISAMLDAMEEGSDVRAYTAWSLMDNFEWLAGYTERFGLYEVDYESAERTRTPRKSAFVYKQIVRTRELDMHYEPDTDVMTIDEGH
ncbi:Myrosinase 1 [Papilio machaon]|uniref:beta-glucosidase n=1 Tax=Papilio machaon TaxID=76193 RepID=A0A194R3Z4_PAPMA|nr:Myrosinase 1 [Papilio machaon]